MRKLALLTTAMLGLAFADPSFAQPNQAGPQPGLPPGAGIGAPNALQPRASGELRTTPTSPAPMAAPMDTSAPPPAPVYHRRARRHRIMRHRHYVRHHAAVAAPTPATSQ